MCIWSTDGTDTPSSLASLKSRLVKRESVCLSLVMDNKSFCLKQFVKLHSTGGTTTMQARLYNHFM